MAGFLLVLVATDGLYLRLLQHLLPTGLAWRTAPVAKTLRKLLAALGATYESARNFVDLAYNDRFPSTTRELTEWEFQFGLQPAATVTDATRRIALASAWAATGGQSPRYLQDTMQDAGFNVYIHEWWDPPNVDPRTARDPRDYTEVPRIGTVQCSAFPTQPRCSLFSNQARCNRFLANEVGYLVNLNLTREAPPPVPDDPDRWRYFLYWGGATFPNPAVIPADRRDEFERLLLKICPAHLWLVTLIEYEMWTYGDGHVFGEPGLQWGLPGP